jgi:hypothetical protein
LEVIGGSRGALVVGKLRKLEAEEYEVRKENVLGVRYLVAKL